MSIKDAVLGMEVRHNEFDEMTLTHSVRARRCTYCGGAIAKGELHGATGFFAQSPVHACLKCVTPGMAPSRQRRIVVDEVSAFLEQHGYQMKEHEYGKIASFLADACREKVAA